MYCNSGQSGEALMHSTGSIGCKEAVTQIILDNGAL